MLPCDTSIWVTFSRPGIHCYPAAPEDVSYLRVPHRHLFKFRVEVEVFHDERDIEYHQFLRWCEERYSTGELQCNDMSCESIARALLVAILTYHPGVKNTKRSVAVEVSEEG